MKLLLLKYFFFALGVVKTEAAEIRSEDTDDEEPKITTEETEIPTKDTEIETEDDTEKTIPDFNRYKVVSQWDEARKFYPEIRLTEPSPDELNIDSHSKKQICRDIFGSHYIGQRTNVALYYTPLSMFQSNTYFFNPVKYVDVSPSITKDDDELSEWAFACPYRRKRNGRKIRAMYISRQYKISGDVNSDDNYVAGRFIFRFYADRFRLDGLAEATATIISHTSISIERIYVDRKINRKLASDYRLDPLCSLKFLETIRVCTAVFGSEFFVEDLDYPDPEINWVNGSCRRETITFQSSVETAEISNEEWMLNCSQSEGATSNFGYLLSQAYTTNELFIYKLTPGPEGAQYFVDNVATNIRFFVD